MTPRRSWLFVPGADEAAHAVAARSGADVIVLELEDFTPPELRAKARALSSEAFDLWRRAVEKARSQGKERAKLGGALIEVPIYAAARRLLQSSTGSGGRTPPQPRKKSS